MTNNILEPLQLSVGSHKPGSGQGCAMNVISWENGDKTITDYPACSNRVLSRMVQVVNDNLGRFGGKKNRLSAEDSMLVLDLGHATVGTGENAVSRSTLWGIYKGFAEKLWDLMDIGYGGRSLRSYYRLYFTDDGSTPVYGVFDNEFCISYQQFRENARVFNFDAAEFALGEMFSAYRYKAMSENMHYEDKVNLQYVRTHFVPLVKSFIDDFKKEAGLSDVETPVEKTQEAIQKMLVVV